VARWAAEVGRARVNVAWAEGHGRGSFRWGVGRVAWERLRREKGRGMASW
jgi:hypothetical protein